MDIFVMPEEISVKLNWYQELEDNKISKVLSTVTVRKCLDDLKNPIFLNMHS